MTNEICIFCDLSPVTLRGQEWQYFSFTFLFTKEANTWSKLFKKNKIIAWNVALNNFKADYKDSKRRPWSLYNWRYSGIFTVIFQHITATYHVLIFWEFFMRVMNADVSSMKVSHNIMQSSSVKEEEIQIEEFIFCHDSSP